MQDFSSLMAATHAFSVEHSAVIGSHSKKHVHHEKEFIETQVRD